MESRGVALPMLGYGLAAGEPAETEELARLLRQAKSGDAAAFEALLRIFEVRVARTALRLLGNRQDAQDAAQEVFLRLHRRISANRQRGKPFRLALSGDGERKLRYPAQAEELACRSTKRGMRWRRRRMTRPIATSSASSWPKPCSLCRRRSGRRVTLRDIEGLSTGEVARILGSSEATVRSQISSARLKIKKILRRRL